MNTKRDTKASAAGGDTANVLKDLMIVQLGLAGVPIHNIRAIVGCDIHCVARITKQLKARKTKGED